MFQKSYIKKTKSGAVHKVVKEHYLRDDIWCSVVGCRECNCTTTSILDLMRSEINTNISDPYLLVVSAEIILHHPDFLEHPALHDVIIAQSVQEEVKTRNQMAYKRLRQIIEQKTEEKRFCVFVNLHHRQTFLERDSESTSAYNNKLLITMCHFYQTHIKKFHPEGKIVLLTDNKEQFSRCQTEYNILAFTAKEFALGMNEKHPSLIDYLSKTESMECESSTNSNDNKIQFAEHLKLDDIKRGIKSCKIYGGVYKANPHNFREGTVMLNEDSKLEFSTVIVSGLININRAIHKDKVAVEIFQELITPSNFIIQDSCQNPDIEIDIEQEISTSNELKSNLTLSSDSKLPTGRIVGMIERKWRQYCGVLLPPIIDTPRISHLFEPDSRTIPRIRIDTRRASELFGQRIVVQIDSWPRSSRYPNGHLVETIGPIGDRNTENIVLLKEYDIPYDDFPPAVINELPTMPGWVIPETELNTRLDLRHLPICSVDPPGCTDIDDALHLKPIPDSDHLVEIGVHIADVSYFIKPKSHLDNEAAKRATTVYLADKRIDMVPEVLSSNLCSLVPGEDRLAFSVIWTINEQTGEIATTQFSKTVIRSKRAFSYIEAQGRIDDVTKNDDITLGLRGLNILAKILKQKRIKKGALILASPEISFASDSETHEPIDFDGTKKEDLSTTSLVEEFMLLANVSTAKKTFETFPKCAILRNHPAPPLENYDPLLKVTKSRGINMDVSSAKTLSHSLESAEIPGNIYSNRLIKILTTRCMQQAKYFCSGSISTDQFYHYGLANDIYTHFTSPIRRYPDILVHRLLSAAIGIDPADSSLTDEKIAMERCNNCNLRNKNAQWMSRASIELNTVILLRGKSHFVEAHIMEVRKNAIRVIIPKYGYEGFVYFDNKLSTTNLTLEFNEETLRLIVNGKFTFATFDMLKVRVHVPLNEKRIQRQRIQLDLVEPVIEGISVPDESDTDLTNITPLVKRLKTGQEK